jgi:hypothetical protein
MENETLSRRLATPLLPRLETFACFAAMMLAIMLEAACVYWLRLPTTIHGNSTATSSLVGEWTAATLPQCWLLGALVALAYRVGAMLVPPKTWGPGEFLRNRRAFLRLWRWAVAVGGVQLSALYLDRLAKVVQ